MGRKRKKGLDYAPWDVDVFLGDREIDKLMESQGCAGFVIYFYLCQMAYKFEGYYLPWSYDDAATTAKRVGGGVGSETVRQTVALCLQIGLFDRRLFDRYGILTSRWIQENFAEAKARQNETPVIAEYWLLEKNYSPGGLVKCSLNPDLCDNNPDLCRNNPDFCNNNSTESRVEENRVEESRVDVAKSARDYFRNNINPNAPQRDLQQLTEFVAFFNQHGGEGDAVATYACQIAQSKQVLNWPFVRKILNDWKSVGAYTLKQCQEHEKNWHGRRKKGTVGESVLTAVCLSSPKCRVGSKKVQSLTIESTE